MGEDNHYGKIHLVEAEDEWEAKQKLENHYQLLNSPYSVSYWVEVEDIEEVIR